MTDSAHSTNLHGFPPWRVVHPRQQGKGKSHDTIARTLVTTAAALPALAVPALASAATSASACTLPADLIERLVRVRAWYLDCRRREEEERAEVDRRFHAATGLTHEQWRDFETECCRAGDYDNPRRKELEAVRHKIYADFPMFAEDDPESNALYDERWAVADAIMAHKPRTVADIAWQVEAYLIADLEMSLNGTPSCEPIFLALLRNIRAAGGLPPPDGPLGALSLKKFDWEA